MSGRWNNLRLLLCSIVVVVSIAATVRSYFAVDKLVHAYSQDATRNRNMFVAISRGRIFFGLQEYAVSPSARRGSELATATMLLIRVLSEPWFAWSWPNELFAFGAGYSKHSGVKQIVIPLWMIAALAAAPLLLRLAPHHRRRARLARGQCSRCGYDRTGLAAAQRCPECNAENSPSSSPR